MLSAECSCKLFRPIFTYRQSGPRSDLEEQSDLGPHCLQKLLLKSQADDKADKIGVIGSLRVNLYDGTSFYAFHYNAFLGYKAIFFFFISGKRMCTLLGNCLED